MKKLLLVAALALTACSRKDPKPTRESVAREEFARKTFADIHADRAWNVSSKSDVQFDEGFSGINYDPGKQDKRPSFYNHAFRWMGQHAHVRLKPHPQKRMKLVVGGWASEHDMRTHPVVQLFIDDYFLNSTDVLDNNGHFYFEQEVPAWMLQREWVNLIVKTNAVGFHWVDPPGLATLVLYRFEWREVPEGGEPAK